MTFLCSHTFERDIGRKDSLEERGGELFTDGSKLAHRIGGEVHCRQLSINSRFKATPASSKRSNCHKRSSRSTVPERSLLQSVGQQERS